MPPKREGLYNRAASSPAVSSPGTIKSMNDLRDEMTSAQTNDVKAGSKSVHRTGKEI